MTRLVVLGNSHMAALKAGWDADPQRWPGVEARFFGDKNAFFKRMELNRRLSFGAPGGPRGVKARESAMKLNGAERIDLSDADVVLIVGRRPEDGDVTALLGAWDVEGMRDTGSKRVMSRPLFETCLREIARRVAPPPPWKALVDRGVRVTLLKEPVPTEGMTTTTVGGDRPLLRRAIARPEGLKACLDLYDDILAATLEAQGMSLLRQPESTRDELGRTLTRFAGGSRRLIRDAAHPSDEARHMNAEYGALCLDMLLAGVGAVPAAP